MVRAPLLTATLILVCGFSLKAQSLPTPKTDADWTVMVYMNAKNNLECAGIANFLDMARVGSTDHVNIIVELGRPEKIRHTNDEEGWTGVLRFRVAHDMHPIPGSAINPDDPTVRGADMGSGETLADFVQWAQTNYPAKKYMLVIWNHGQGWRLYQAHNIGARAVKVAYRYRSSTADDEPKPCNAQSQQTLTGGFRSVSFDDDTGHFLYNRDIQNRLRGQQLDVLGFDACLMAMIESAYAFRDVAKVMVASEELVPGDGWNYSLWMQDMINDPHLDAKQLAQDIVRSYKATYKDGSSTTLSVTDLSKVREATQELGRLSLMIKAKIATEEPILAYTRTSFRTFGDWYSGSWQDCHGSSVVRFQSIDLVQFLRLYGRETKDMRIKKEIALTEQKIKGLLISNYASAISSGAGHWASGVAIYFPATEMDFQCDSDKDGYDTEAVRAGLVPYPPEFVEEEGWADMLHEYLRSLPAPRSESTF